MQLNSQKITLQQSSETVFNYLKDVRNFESLMPESISKFEVLSDDTFVFALKGMPEITLKQAESLPHSKIVLKSADKKLEFALNVNINTLTETSSEVFLNFEGKFNTMMSMMIKNPISKFIETLITNVPSALNN